MVIHLLMFNNINFSPNFSGILYQPERILRQDSSQQLEAEGVSDLPGSDLPQFQVRVAIIEWAPLYGITDTGLNGLMQRFSNWGLQPFLGSPNVS